MRCGSGESCRFFRDERASVALIFALCSVVVMLTVGLAIDGGRAYSASTKVAAAMDAAALAGAKMLNETTLNDSEIKAATLVELNANLRGMGLGYVSVQLPATQSDAVILDRVQSSASLVATVSVKPMFGRLAGITTLDFPKTSTAVYNMAKIELVMALDVTGSMNQIPAGDTVSKIDTLKVVAADMVTSIFDLASTDTNVRIGLVPWSSAVNAGDYADLVNGTSSSSGWLSRFWAARFGVPTNCVAERTGGGEVTDAPPAVSNITTAVPSLVCPDEEVLPLIGRTQRLALLSTINGLTAANSTAGHIGAAWAWYLISPNWASYFPSGSEPTAYNSPTVKSVIMMTDGIFNIDYVPGSLGRVGSYDDTSYALFQQNCAGMRAKGITVYTILFDLTDARAVTEMQTCAGSPANYFYAANAAGLSAAFAAIVRKLNVVRVSK